MISVIVPVYNTSEYLPGVVETLLNQDFDPGEREIIFVDNGSDDQSLQILESCDGITVLSETERGSYAARNRGIRTARGDILVFMDSDCFPVPSWLSAIERQLAHDPAGILMGPRTATGAEREMELVARYENAKAEYVFSLDEPQVYFGYTGNMAVRRSVMEQFGPFELRDRGADTIFVRRVVEDLGTNAVNFCPGMIVRHGELESLETYYQKVRTYSRSRQAYRHIIKVRPLSLSERMTVFHRVAGEYGWKDACQLFFLLARGQTAWWRGGINVKTSDS